MASLSQAIRGSLTAVILQDRLHHLVLPAIGLGSEDSEDMAAAAATVARAVMTFSHGLMPQPVNPVRSLAFQLDCKSWVPDTQVDVQRL